MAEQRRLEEDEVRRAIARVADAADADAWAELAFDRLSQQAEGRQLLAAPESVARRASELGLDPDAEFAQLLARGAQSASERALVAAFAVRGLGVGLAADVERAAGDKARLLRFLRHADWLELSTPYGVYAFVDGVLPKDVAAGVWQTAGELLVRAHAADAAGVAALALRIAALAESDSEAASEALAQARGDAESAQVRALAAALTGGVATALLSRLAGVRVRPRPGLFRHFLSLLSGWSLLRWLVSLLAFTVGLRRRATLALSATGIDVETEDILLGRSARRRRVSRPLREVTRVVRGARYPSLHLLVGALGFAAGVIFGGLTFFDGVRTGETVLLLVGAGLILGGGLLDLAITTLWPARRGRIEVELHFDSGPAIAIGGLSEQDADAFVDAVAARLR